MKVVRGAAAARKYLKRRGLPAAAVPEAVAARIAALFGEALTPEQAVARIIADVAQRGDAAVLEYTRRLDGPHERGLVVSDKEIDEAASAVGRDLREALQEAADRVRAFHQACLPVSWFDEQTGLGQSIQPLGSIGVYVPGGTAAYPSTVLHTAVPARVAGVGRVVMATPPGRDGRVDPAVLAAARIARVDRVFRMGGAQAIAALALGTETVPRADKVFGPGNIFVTLAKRQLYGSVGIDGLFGPTETLIVADGSARAELCAADLLAQAEHDALAAPLLITTSETLASEVRREIEGQLATLERSDTARAAIEGQGLAAVVDTLDEAIELANDFAPEHLCLMVEDARSWARKVRNAGGVFLGEGSPEVLGDYNAGPSHVMPTGGTARFASALGLHEFVKVTSVIGLSPETSRRLSAGAARIARAEGLSAHARSAELRLARRKKGRPSP